MSEAGREGGGEGGREGGREGGGGRGAMEEGDTERELRQMYV